MPLTVAQLGEDPQAELIQLSWYGTLSGARTMIPGVAGKLIELHQILVSTQSTAIIYFIYQVGGLRYFLVNTSIANPLFVNFGDKPLLFPTSNFHVMIDLLVSSGSTAWTVWYRLIDEP